MHHGVEADGRVGEEGRQGPLIGQDDAPLGVLGQGECEVRRGGVPVRVEAVAPPDEGVDPRDVEVGQRRLRQSLGLVGLDAPVCRRSYAGRVDGVGAEEGDDEIGPRDTEAPPVQGVCGLCTRGRQDQDGRRPWVGSELGGEGTTEADTPAEEDDSPDTATSASTSTCP